MSKEIINRYRKADLVIGNNVYAHVPDINDFTKGIKNILNLNGTVTLEFPHLFNLVKHNQFDTIYHEHYSYLSLYTVRKIFAEHNLKIFHVEKIFTHGGSLRVYGCHQTNNKKINKSVSKILTEERNAGLLKLKSYKNLQKNADKTKLEFINFLKKLKSKNKIISAYGAAAKGNTLLNFCNIKNDTIDFVFDASESKQNKYLPGSHIKILNPRSLLKKKVDYLLILPWNIKNEIMNSYKSLKNKGVIFFTAMNGIKIEK